METVLGDHLQAIRVSRLDDYASAIDAFEEGGVTLMEASMDVNMTGDLPSLASLIRSHELHLGSVLQGIYAAESIGVAMANRATLGPGESIITRQGVWVGPDWIRRYLIADEEAGIIQRAQELETLNLRVEEAEQTLAEMTAHLAEGKSRIESLEKTRESRQGEINSLNQSLGELKTDHGVRQVQLEEADARKARLARERAELVAQIDDGRDHICVTIKLG